MATSEKSGNPAIMLGDQKNAARYACELTFYIGRNVNGVKTGDDLVHQVLSSSDLGKGGCTIADADGFDQDGKPERSSVVTKSFFLQDQSDAERAVSQVRDFLNKVFTHLNQKSILVRFETVDSERRQVVATDNRIVDPTTLRLLTGSYLLPLSEPSQGG